MLAPRSRFALAALVALLAPSTAHATYSIAATDSRTSQVGAAGYSCAGGDVSGIARTVGKRGVVISQNFRNACAAQRGVELLSEGADPEEILAEMKRRGQQMDPAPTELRPTLMDAGVTDDGGRFPSACPDPTPELVPEPGLSVRQYAIVDLEGRYAQFDGPTLAPFAGSTRGQVETFTWVAQANIMNSQEIGALDGLVDGEGYVNGGNVWDIAGKAFEAGGCDLADRLMNALLAPASEGKTDLRCRVNPNVEQPIRPAAGAFLVLQPPGAPRSELRVSIQNSADPLEELKKHFQGWRAQNPCPTLTAHAGDGFDGEASGGRASAEASCSAAGGADRAQSGALFAAGIALALGARRRRAKSSPPCARRPSEHRP